MSMAADGWFHAFVWLCTVVGVWRLYRAARVGDHVPPPRRFAGMLLVGWGASNTIAVLIDHHLLGLRHVHDLPVPIPSWDWAFLMMTGLGFLAMGTATAREE